MKIMKKQIEKSRAFPQKIKEEVNGGIQERYELGLTMRDYFAAKAMQAMLSNQEMWSNNDTMEDYVSQESYKMADAMLKERLK